MKLSEMTSAQRRISNLAVLASVLVLGVVGVTTAAKAEEGTINGYSVVAVDNGSNSHDAITAYGPKGVETIGVKCYGFGRYDWNSYGPNSQQFVDSISREWCSDY